MAGENPYHSSLNPILERATKWAASPVLDVVSLLQSPLGQLFRFWICGSPIIFIGLCVAFWGYASAMHGALAKPNVPDPKSFLGGVPATVLVLMPVAVLASFPIVIAISWVTKQWLRHFGGYVASLLLAIAFSRYDALQILVWLAD